MSETDPSQDRQRALQTWSADADRRARAELLRELYQVRRDQRPRLTQAEVARRMGISQATVSAFESRKAVPRLATLQRYARAVGYRLVLLLDAVSPEQQFAVELAEFDLPADPPGGPADAPAGIGPDLRSPATAAAS